MNIDIKKDMAPKKERTWYMKGVNINYSFHTLETLAASLGAEIENGDILIVDNSNGDKRKVFKKTKNLYIILYASLLNKNFFSEIRDGDGKIDGKRSLVEWIR